MLVIVSGVERRRALQAWHIASAGEKPHDRHVVPLFEKQDGRCYICRRRLLPRHTSPRDPDSRTRDHVFPRAGGGKGHTNILLAHRRCNSDKDDRWPFPCEVIFLAAVYAAPPSDAALLDRRIRAAAAQERYTQMRSRVARTAEIMTRYGA